MNFFKQLPKKTTYFTYRVKKMFTDAFLLLNKGVLKIKRKHRT